MFSSRVSTWQKLLPSLSTLPCAAHATFFSLITYADPMVAVSSSILILQTLTKPPLLSPHCRQAILGLPLRLGGDNIYDVPSEGPDPALWLSVATQRLTQSQPTSTPASTQLLVTSSPVCCSAPAEPHSSAPGTLSGLGSAHSCVPLAPLVPLEESMEPQEHLRDS